MNRSPGNRQGAPPLPAMDTDRWIYGVQPVLEALQGEQNPVEKIWIAFGRSGAPVDKILSLAKQRKVPVAFKNRNELDKKTGTSKHQGVVALGSLVEMIEWKLFLGGMADYPETPRFLALLDEVQDPHNLGAVIRTACAVGLQGLLLPKRHTCPITPTVVKASAGSVAHVPLVRVGNAAQALERLRRMNILVLGADPGGSQTIYRADLDQDLCLVVGGEGKGLRPVIKKQCDALVSIPMVGPIGSLNVSVSAGLLFYEVLRQRLEKI